MIGRVIEIAADGQHLWRDHGSMVVSKDREEVGRVPLDDIAVLLCSGRGTTYANSLLVELARRGAAAVLCGDNFLPAAWLWPLEGHHLQALRMRQQLDATRPMQKRLWQAVVRAKILGQKSALEALAMRVTGFADLAKNVRSGDPENVEGQAARRYWGRMFGRDFRRERFGPWPNPALNYGYTVLRAAVARAVAAAGLHPSLGIHHSHRGNPFCLVDDLMEPFRPVVDLAVVRLMRERHTEVTSEAKRALTEVLLLDLQTERGTTPLLTCLERAAQSLAQSYETGRMALRFPALNGAGLASGAGGAVAEGGDDEEDDGDDAVWL